MASQRLEYRSGDPAGHALAQHFAVFIGGAEVVVTEHACIHHVVDEVIGVVPALWP